MNRAGDTKRTNGTRRFYMGAIVFCFLIFSCAERAHRTRPFLPYKKRLKTNSPLVDRVRSSFIDKTSVDPVLPSFTGLYRVLHSFLPSFTEFHLPISQQKKKKMKNEQMFQIFFSIGSPISVAGR